MKLRLFEEQDRTAFLDMCTDFYAGGAALHPIPRAQMEQSFQQIMDGSPYIQGFLFLEEGQVAGYALVYPFYSNEMGGLCLMLEEIYIKPQFRGRGLGSQYLQQVAKAFGRPVAGLKLEVCPENEGARKLYERSGFHPLAYQSMVKTLPENGDSR